LNQKVLEGKRGGNEKKKRRENEGKKNKDKKEPKVDRKPHH
jgi:hypothetical protein